jgi:Arc/MetJ-type ribon-helix-helix transcriptional regulator
MSNPARETRISVRLFGPLADHANRLVDSSLYSTHSEYIRDLIRRDMSGDRENDQLLKAWSNSYSQLANGNYRTIPQKDLFEKAMKELTDEGTTIAD